MSSRGSPPAGRPEVQGAFHVGHTCSGQVEVDAGGLDVGVCTAVGGNGVAVEKASGDRTYMKMGTAGVGFGLGANKYQVVFLFQDKATFDNFVEKGWQADAQASAAAGNAAAEVSGTFRNGIAYFQLTQAGLMASADISGTRPRTTRNGHFPGWRPNA